MESEAAASPPSFPSPSSQLSDLRRAEVLAHTRYPQLGSWYPPAFGLAAAAFTAAYALPVWASVLVWLILLTIGGALARVYIDRRGTSPDWRRAPAPIKRELKYFYLAYGLIIFSIAFTFMAVSWWAASAVAFTAFTIGLTIYERRYAVAARQAEAEAGITP